MSSRLFRSLYLSAWHLGPVSVPCRQQRLAFSPGIPRGPPRDGRSSACAQPGAAFCQATVGRQYPGAAGTALRTATACVRPRLPPPQGLSPLYLGLDC